MSITTTELEWMSEIEMNILLNKNPWDLGAMNVSADMWNFIRALGIDGHRTIVQVVKDYLEVEALSREGKSTMTISYSM